MLREEIVEVIYDAVRRTNELRPPDDQIPCREDVQLFGSGGVLDSLGLVSFILDIEDAIATQGGVQMVLADDKAMSQRRNPFRDVAVLADYIACRLEENQLCKTAL